MTYSRSVTVLICLVAVATRACCAHSGEGLFCSVKEGFKTSPSIVFPDHLKSNDAYQAAWKTTEQGKQGPPAYSYTEVTHGKRTRGELAVLWVLPARICQPGYTGSCEIGPNTAPKLDGPTQVYPPVTVACGTRLDVMWDSTTQEPRIPHDLWLTNSDEACPGIGTIAGAPNCPLQATFYESEGRVSLIPRRLSATLSAYPISACVSERLQTNGTFSLLCGVNNHCLNAGLRLNITVEGCPDDNQGHSRGYRKFQWN